MRNRIVLFLMLFLLAFTFLGCDGFSSNGTTPTNDNYNTGTAGLKVNFMTNSPPSELFNGQSFPIIIEVYNQGVTDTSPYVVLTGFDTNILRVDWTSRQGSKVSGKSQMNPTGGYGVIEDNVRVSLPNDINTFSSPLTAIICYDYITEGVTSVCVDPDPTNNKDDVCSARISQLSGGQGAPVAITKVEAKPSIGVNYFLITISNMDKTGQIIKSSKVSTCTDLDYDEVDVVDIASATLGTRSMTCEPSTIRLVNGVGATTCEVSGLGNGNAYTTSMVLNLRYGVKTSISKSLNIRRM